ncbi:MAG: hypothetical protein M3R25_07765, partial [Bacteroidota bacterium]|nr:hypothetical protein [Bacteroidota bacterium]
KEYSGKDYSNPEKIKFGYSGNLGSAHDPSFLLELINQLDPSKHHMLLSLYGTKAKMITDKVPASDLITYKNSLSYDEIADIDINIASLLPEWNHVCVPSKAVTAICCGSPVLLNSEPRTDNWEMLQTGSWLIEPAPSYEIQIQNFLSDLNTGDISNRRVKARELSQQLNKDLVTTYNEIAAFVEKGGIKQFSPS